MKYAFRISAFIGCCAFSADKYAIESVGSSVPGEIKVRFANSAAPSADDAVNPAHWIVTAFTKQGHVTGTLDGTPETRKQYAIVPIVVLRIKFNGSSQWPADTARYSVIYTQDGQVSQARIASPTKPPNPEVKTNTDNDLTLFGGINTAVGSKPTFKIDGTMDLHPLLNGFGISAKVRTDNRRQVDPDSFSVKVDYRYLLSTPTPASGQQAVFQGAELQVGFGGVEFDRKRKNLNFIASPQVILPFTFHTSANGAVTSVVGFDLKFGFEGGNNFRNSLNENGYGGFLRTLSGGRGVIILRNIPGFTKVTADCNYEVRLPNKAELFGTTDNAGNTTYVYSKKARHWVSSSVNFFFNEHWSFTAQHSFGSLPPAFNFTDQQLSLGLKFTLKDK